LSYGSREQLFRVVISFAHARRAQVADMDAVRVPPVRRGVCACRIVVVLPRRCFRSVCPMCRAWPCDWLLIRVPLAPDQPAGAYHRRGLCAAADRAGGRLPRVPALHSGIMFCMGCGQG
jgi:hypothetical protein